MVDDFEKYMDGVKKDCPWTIPLKIDENPPDLGETAREKKMLEQKELDDFK